MGSAAGPKLHGIGRSGDSNLLLCLDAHDAGSYPGEPASNYVNSVVGEGAGVGPATPITLGEFGQLRNLVPIFETYGLVPYTMTMEIKGNIAGTCHVYMQNGSYTKYSFVSQSVTLTTEYQRFTFSNLTPAGPTAAWLANTPTDERAMLAMYTGYGSGRNPTVKNIQIELGAYATPFVESRLIDPYAQGYTARPVSVNLMIHGDVGTGTSFSDSSPSKHTVGGTASMAHSSAQSKFSGGSIYFPSADYLTATSSDFAFGTIDWTIDFWMNQSTTLGWASPVDTYGVAGHGFILGFDASTNYLAFYSESGIGWANAYGSHAGTSFALTNGTWYHVAYVRNGNAFTCYVDGAVYFTATLSASDNFTSTGLYMGRRGNMNGSYEGYLDEVRVCRGTALWTSVFTPPTRRNRSAPVVDLSGNYNGVNLITKSATDVATYRDGQVIEPVASALWDFDGTDEYFDTGLYLSSTCSISCWYKREETDITDGNDGRVLNINCWNNTGSSNFFYMMVTDPYYNPSPGGSVEVWAYGFTAGGRDDWYPSGQQYPSLLNVWRNIVLTFDGSSGYVYIDGEYKGSDTLPFTGWRPGDPGYSASGNGQSTLLFGGRRGYGGTGVPTSFLNGQMANCMVFNHTLTAAQVKQNFNAQRSRFGV